MTLPPTKRLPVQFALPAFLSTIVSFNFIEKYGYRTNVTYLISKVFFYLRTEGFKKTVSKICDYIANILKQIKFQKNILTLNNIEDRFTQIYKTNFWGDEESVSGSGSTLAYTENLRKELPELFKKFSIRSIFDAPCGDFNWMKYVLNETHLNYTGGDIVLPLIEDHNLKYKNANTRFVHIDLRKQIFPQADLMICRDCLFHLSFDDIKLVLRNFIDSHIPYLLTTTFVKSQPSQNVDIVTGDFHFIDLFTAPFNFPREVLFAIEDWIPPNKRRQMCLWSREQIISVLD